MKFHFLILLFLLLPFASLPAQDNGIAQTSELLIVPAGDKFLRWYGHEGRSYFLQVSDANNPLAKWLWAPVIESGNNGEISYEVDGTPENGFFRLRYTDQVPTDGDTLETADFDGDGISNIDEIDPASPLAATDPLNGDTDGDNLTDKWERDNGLDPNDNGSNYAIYGAFGDIDGDEVSNLEEQVGDTDPNNPNDFPPQVIWISKGSYGSSIATPNNPDPYSGYCYWGAEWLTAPWSEGPVAVATTPSYLDSLLNGVAFPAIPPVPAVGESPTYYRTGLESSNVENISSVSVINAEADIAGGVNSARVWIKAPISASEQRFHLLKLQEISTQISATNTETKELTSTQAVEVVVPANQSLSNPLDLKHIPTMVTGCEVISSEHLYQVEINSMDRYLSGSIPQIAIDKFGGESKFGLVFRNPSSGETYTFNKLSVAHVYDDPFGATKNDEDKFLSNSEIAVWADGPISTTKELTQDVVFYRKNGRLHFRALFDQAGAIEIGLIKDGQEVSKIDWTLTPDAEIADLLETIDSILSENYDDGGIGVAAMQAGLSQEDLDAIQNTAPSVQSTSSGFGGFLCRNLTIKVNIPTWAALKDNFEQGARKTGAAVDRAITMATFAGKGFCEGAWVAVKDDATSLVELGKMILNPAETAKTFYEGFKVLIGLDLEGWKNVGKTLIKSFLEKGEEGVGEWTEPNALDVAAYLVGFSAGFITEQIAVTYVTAGILKAGNVGEKIGQFIRKASKGVLNGLAETAGNLVRRQAMKAKNSIFRRFSQDVLSTEDVKKLKHMLQELELLCPL